jgi:hypothetical protein
VPGGLGPETIARLIARHGSLDAAAQKAQRDPRFEARFRAIRTTQMLYGARTGPEGAAERAALDAEFWQLVAAWDRLVETAPAPWVQHRDPLPVDDVREVVRRHVVGGESWREIIKRGLLSKRKTEYVAKALTAGDLGWDVPSGALTLGGGTENSSGGIRLPKR